ncbi:MAG: hypothetical protein IPG67_03280 [Acidobacteria bacterium]|nr:hypothetical protein [Acidobacteriota bacterium]
MIQSVEQLAETVKALPQSDRDRFLELIESGRTEPKSNGATRTELDESLARFKKAEHWIRTHKDEYDGQWVCLYGDQLIAHGLDGKKVFDEARAKGIESPFIERINANELPFGGW